MNDNDKNEYNETIIKVKYKQTTFNYINFIIDLNEI